MDSPTRPRHEENHPLPWDGVVKESEGGGRFVQLCREEEEDGRWPDGGWSGMEWSSSREHTCTTSVERVPLKADEAREVACKSLAYVDRAGEVQKSKSLRTSQNYGPLVVASSWWFLRRFWAEREGGGLIYAHFNMTANTSSPVSAAPLHSAEKERKTGERVMAADMLMRTKCQGDRPSRTCSDNLAFNIG